MVIKFVVDFTIIPLTKNNVKVSKGAGSERQLRQLALAPLNTKLVPDAATTAY